MTGMIAPTTLLTLYYYCVVDVSDMKMFAYVLKSSLEEECLQKRAANKKDPSEDGGDQLQQWRERCADEAADLKKILDECSERVNSRKQTEERCAQDKRSVSGRTYLASAKTPATVVSRDLRELEVTANQGTEKLEPEELEEVHDF
ncbi:unnamed protein product [Angiostrongylus costaricensis]|uniref:UCR_hinge domain-containing protein n=1 Tax=Angiostrongylus costaricensis TaxID=334426 RepID=A0A0R3PXQ0_ANGCS|nr:unnamed protein product [Angiostrongylus costaricensis]